MTNFFVQHKEKIYEFLRFGLVGLVATAIHYIIYLIILNWLSVTISYTIGYLISFIFNFVLTNNFTFKTKPTVIKGFGFMVSHVINYLMHIVLLTIFVTTILGTKFAPLAVYAIVIPLNFVIVRFVFKKLHR